jgi:hypothetical protein
MKKMLVLILCLGLSQATAWEVDLSRRQVDFNRVTNQQRLPASAVAEEPLGLLQKALNIPEVSQDIVIMQTEGGFVPEKVNVKKNGSYKIYVVNVNAKQKNSSFILDAFSEHHATAYGKVKTFTISPKTDGVFVFQSPETGVEGRLIVAPNAERLPSSR